ncbi:RHS repeat domain-containing protein, partial [Chryseobacterium sp.]
YNFENNKYIYNYTDHLGNVRLSYFNNGNGAEVLEENNYYPFGLKHEGYNATVGNVSYRYKYNGKELQETGMYDYGARFYMPDIGRWGVVDPLAEKYFDISPFNYTANNPILYIDPDGMQLDLSDIMKKGNEEQYKAFVFFAKTKEGQAFLSKYVAKDQKIEYGGKTIFEAKANGEFHDKGIDLSYGIKTDKSDEGGATTGKMKNDRVDISIMISKNAYGESGSKFFNTLRQITHESFMHGDLTANNLRDDGYPNSSNIPKEYRKYDTDNFKHGQHYYIQNEYLANPSNNAVNTYPIQGYKILKQANEALKLKLGNNQIKSEMWQFDGSFIKVNAKGNLERK